MPDSIFLTVRDLIVFVGICLWVFCIVEWIRRAVTGVETLSKNLIERNEKLIDSYVAKVTDWGGANYVDNQTIDCLGAIAKLEGKRRLIPAHGEGLSDWQKRTHIPKEWLLLKDHIKARIDAE